MEKKIKIGSVDKKGGYKGNKMWRTHRLEGAVKNKGIKPAKKKKLNID